MPSPDEYPRRMHHAFPGQMTTSEAVDYLNERLTEPISKDWFLQMRSWVGEPISRQGTSRSWYHRGDLDAFLSAYGTDPEKWIGPPR